LIATTVFNIFDKINSYSYEARFGIGAQGRLQFEQSGGDP
jgi:hypothetical protein